MEEDRQPRRSVKDLKLMFEKPKPAPVHNQRASQKNSNLGDIFLLQSGVKKSSELRTAFSPKREADV